MKFCLIPLVGLLLLTSPGWAVTPWDLAKISESVAEESWEKSEAAYRELLQNSPAARSQRSQLEYNLGLSLYHQEKYEEALELFEKVSQDKSNRELQAQASYNKGNTLYKLERKKEAKEAFKQALLLDPHDDDARYNLEQISDEEKQNQKNNQDQEDNNQDNQDKKNDKQDQQKDDQDKKDDKQDQQKGDQEKKDDKQEPQKGNPDQKDGQQKPQKGDQKSKQGQQPQMSEAERRAQEKAQERARLLEFFKQQERDGRPPVRVAPQAPPVGGKTW